MNCPLNGDRWEGWGRWGWGVIWEGGAEGGSPIPCTELPAGRTDVAGPLYRAQQGERGGGEPINALQYNSSRQGGGNGALQGGERDGESIPGECILLSS